MNEYKIFDSKEFKSLPWYMRFFCRLKIAFFETLRMY